MVQLSKHFASEGRSRHSEWLRQQRWFIKAQQDHQRRESDLERQEDSLTALGGDLIMATQAQIESFEVRLDTYDQATVEALMENQELLDAVNDRIDAMLSQAYVMEDGRRVFRTEDGTQVFDEHGELSPDEIDPSLPTWEAYAPLMHESARLTAERTEILEFQDRLDDAREQIAEGEISEADLEALDADLLEAMPDAVRAHVPDIEPREVTPSLTAQFRPSAAESTGQTQRIETPVPAPLPFQ